MANLERVEALNSALYFLDLCGVSQDIYGLGMEAEVNALTHNVLELDAHSPGKAVRELQI